MNGIEPRMNTDEHGLKHVGLTERILGAFYSVYNELGHGFLESVYEAAMTIELERLGLQVSRQVDVPVWFRGQRIGDFRADLIVEDAVLLELKSVHALDRVHEAQLLHYLRATPIEVGLLLNFGVRPQFRRLRYDNELKTIREYPCESVAK